MEAKRKGEAAQGVVRVKAKPVRFVDVLDRFLEEYASQRRSDHYIHATKAARVFFGERAMTTITRAQVEDFARLRRAGQIPGFVPKRVRKTTTVGDATIRRELLALGTLWRWAIDRDLARDTPVERVSKPAEPRHRVAFIARADWPAIEAAAPPWIRPLLVLGVHTALRLKEIVSLRWCDVDLEHGQLHVDEATKTGYRVTPLNETARALLAKLRAEQDARRRESMRAAGVVVPPEAFVFVDEQGAPYTSTRRRNEITQKTRVLLRAHGYATGGFHLLRHSCASWLAIDGAPIYEIAQVLGHKDVSMTSKYAHLMPRHLQATVSRLDGLWTPVPAAEPKSSEVNTI